MATILSNLQDLKPVLVMVVTELGFTGANFMYTTATANDMSIQVLILYQLLIGAIFTASLALITERDRIANFTRRTAFCGFLCALFGGILGDYLYVKSLSLTSATFVAAMSNLIPGFTLLLALTLRMENLNIGTAAGKAKILGTVFGIAGAMVLTVVKGKKITILSLHVDLVPPQNHSAIPSNNFLGPLLALSSSLSDAIWMILATKLSQNYPCYSSTALTCFIGSILAGVFAIFTVKDWSLWKLGWDYRLLAAAYLGIVVHGLAIAALAWCTRIKGPLFTTSFGPLGLVFTALAESLFLNKDLYLGSLIGCTIITAGIYLLIWGKAKETTVSEAGTTDVF